MKILKIEYGAKKCWLIRKFLSVKYLEDLDKVIINEKIENLKQKKQTKIAKKIGEIFSNYKYQKIIICKQIKENELFIDMLNSQNVDIIDGRYLFKLCIYKILEYITKIKKIKLQEANVAILINQKNELVDNEIIQIAEKVKNLTIVTNKIRKFRDIENFLYTKGIVITVTNNKKGAGNSQVIINVDFASERVNELKIFNEAILVNCEENIRISKKRYNGTTINWYKANAKNLEKKEIYLENEFIELNYFLGKIEERDIGIKCLITGRGKVI